VKPVLVVHGRLRKKTYYSRRLFPVAVLALGLLLSARFRGQFLPWTNEALTLLLGLCGTWVFLGAAYLAVRRHSRARMGRVAFYDDRIVFKQGGAPLVIEWSRVRGFLDSSRDYVELVVAPVESGDRRRACLPTPTEECRVSVLDLLTNRGLGRTDADVVGLVRSESGFWLKQIAIWPLRNWQTVALFIAGWLLSRWLGF
jgi:hypothetical protein